jgi:phosphoglycolate phosphatase
MGPLRGTFGFEGAAEGEDASFTWPTLPQVPRRGPQKRATGGWGFVGRRRPGYGARVSLIIFDFDGVIADSRAAIMEAVQTLAHEKGVPAVTDEELATVAMRDLFRRMRIRWWEIPRYVKKGRQALVDNRDRIVVQPNILPVLRWATGQGLPMAILSSNTEALIADFVAAHMPWARFAPVVGGVSLFAKHRALKRLLRRVPAPQEPLAYVGDEVRDVRAAHRVGIRSIAVTWGKDGAGLLASAGPTALVASGDELVAAFQRLGLGVAARSRYA